MTIKRVSFDEFSNSEYNDHIVYHINFFNSMLVSHEKNGVKEHEPLLTMRLVPDINFIKFLDIIEFTIEKKLSVTRLNTIDYKPLVNKNYYKVLLPALKFSIHNMEVNLASEIYHCHNRVEMARAIHTHILKFLDEVRRKNVELKREASKSPKKYEKKELSNFLLLAYDISKIKSIENLHLLERIKSNIEKSCDGINFSNSVTVDVMDTPLDDYVIVDDDSSLSKKVLISNIAPFHIKSDKVILMEVEPDRYQMAYHYHDLEHIINRYHLEKAGLRYGRLIYDSGFDNCTIALNSHFEKMANSPTGYREISGRYVIFANKELAKQYIMMKDEKVCQALQ